MNREIKFRAWDNGNGYMVTSKQGVFTALQHYMDITRQDNGYYNNGELLKPIKDKYILMQYTGLKDKNGKEIYEGDLINFANDKCAVKYGEYHFSACDEYDCERMGYYIETSKGGGGYVDTNTGVPLENICKHYEVIGNIYENEVTNANTTN